jgi:hypothetical protein
VPCSWRGFHSLQMTRRVVTPPLSMSRNAKYADIDADSVVKLFSREPTMSLSQETTCASKVCCSLIFPALEIVTYLAEMDKETFQKMWDLSAPGGQAEGCFLRLQQTEWYHELRKDFSSFSWMPDVSSSF